MNEQEAMLCLKDIEGKTPSEIGEAVDVLYRKHGTYDKLAEHVQLSHPFLSRRHHIFQLPQGIRRKVDEGQLGLTQAEHIHRLRDERSQWLLAVIAVEKNLRANECENVVNIVLKQGQPIEDALATSTGVRFDEISPPVLLLPIGVDFWFTLSKVAWEQGKDWQDLCYELIKRGIDVDLLDAATRLEEIAESFRQAGNRFSEDVKE